MTTRLTKYLKFEPKEDITAYEIALIMKAMQIALDPRVLDKHPECMLRHFVEHETPEEAAEKGAA
jgi:hypothetical protein